jgi:hypothetical protein
MRVIIRLVKVGVVALTAMLGVAAADAVAALPDLHITLGESFPVSSIAKSTTANWAFSTAGGTILSGKGVEATLTWQGLGSLGAYVLDLLEAKKGIKKCKTVGDVAGTVLLSGEVHLVFVQLSPVLVVALLFLVPKTKVECEGLNGTIEGSFLGSYNGFLNAEVTEFKSDILGEKGKQSLVKYENEAGTAVEALLLSEVGTGFTKTSLNIDEELTFKVNKMIEVLG